MEILDLYKTKKIRKDFTEYFVDVNSDYYLHRIKNKKLFSDGYCYTGYLWDCFKNPTVQTPDFCLQLIKRFKVFYVFWDIHSCENILIPNYWKYPKDSVLKLDYFEFCSIKNDLPEDIYVFDDSFLWCIAFTHEQYKEQQFCVLTQRKE